MGNLSSVNSETPAPAQPAFHRIRAASRRGLRFVPRRPLSEPILQKTAHDSSPEVVLISLGDFAERHRLSERQVPVLLDAIGMRSICLDGLGYVVEPDTSDAIRRWARKA